MRSGASIRLEDAQGQVRVGSALSLSAVRYGGRRQIRRGGRLSHSIMLQVFSQLIRGRDPAVYAEPAVEKMG